MSNTTKKQPMSVVKENDDRSCRRPGGRELLFFY